MSLLNTKKILENKHSKFFEQSWELYIKSFPKNERRTKKTHLKAMRDKRFFPIIYISPKSELLALCFYWKFSTFIYLEHLAVNSNCRSQGIGSKIIQEIIQEKLPVVLEIDPPFDAISKQRLHFYQKNKFILTDYTFRQLKYQKRSDELFLNLLCSVKMDNRLFQEFKNTIYLELTKYCE